MAASGCPGGLLVDIYHILWLQLPQGHFMDVTDPLSRANNTLISMILQSSVKYTQNVIFISLENSFSNIYAISVVLAWSTRLFSGYNNYISWQCVWRSFVGDSHGSTKKKNRKEKKKHPTAHKVLCSKYTTWHLVHFILFRPLYYFYFTKSYFYRLFDLAYMRVDDSICYWLLHHHSQGLSS